MDGDSLSDRKVGIADTTFAQYDMGSLAVEILKEESDVDIERYTVPSYTELPVACKRLIESYECSIVLAFSLSSFKSRNVDRAHPARGGLNRVAVETGTHVLDVHVDANETKSREEMVELIEDRVDGYVRNTLELLSGKEALTPDAGTGVRHGIEDIDPLTGGN